ncbi:AraC family transcriptional regulator [Gordonia sp. NB41Y]|uniref:GlxA family transcriptional regulator n=1 Tax=Gordonia sp. NB41Y TaxID=875808 RepID=UPI0006B1A942|nr:AraC family transcriptional regulator [Gordonia sp. NB41Y]KOY49064.1 AraC family transcriptional regulator [Gordonia sp. NB41Y]WLP89410.1 helix-turn-helix domain-containing protein [Gordonia sp. NB41Y]
MHIAIYVFDGVSMFHVAAPQMVFRDAADLAPDTGDWRITLWSTTPDAVSFAEGHGLTGVSGPEAITDADILIIPSWPDHWPEPDADLTALICAAHARGAVVAGLCFGAVAVADTGILAGRSAVTHWVATDVLARRGRCGSVDDSVLYIDHGDVITSAGTVSSIDACLHLIRRLRGTDLANRVARRMVVAPHRDGGQAQYIERPLPETRNPTSVSAVLDWALTHLDDDLGVDRLAARARMSRRTFLRHFRESTGTTPARWVVQQRLEAARSLLETTDHDLRQVAHTCGFASEVTFRQNFVARYGVAPSAYRLRFSP